MLRLEVALYNNKIFCRANNISLKERHRTEFPGSSENSVDLATPRTTPRRAAAAVPRQFLRFHPGGTTYAYRDAVSGGCSARKGCPIRLSTRTFVGVRAWRTGRLFCGFKCLCSVYITCAASVSAEHIHPPAFVFRLVVKSCIFKFNCIWPCFLCDPQGNR